MSKYIELGKVKEMVFNADISMAETEALYKSLDNLPTIEVSEERQERQDAIDVLTAFTKAVEGTYEDCISREWLLKFSPPVCATVICGECPFDGDDGNYCRLADFIMNAPSVVPKPEESEWEELGQNKDKTHNIRCKACGAAFKSKGHANSLYTREKSRFCSNCGAKMKG